MAFTLHPRLARDTFDVGNLAFCRVLLMNNRLFPWVVLVPRLDNVTELTDLSPSQRGQLMEETVQVSRALQQETNAHKMNIATLGNLVPQLHLHVVARFRDDKAWPNPVWGNGAETYGEAESEPLIQALKRTLGLQMQA